VIVTENFEVSISSADGQRFLRGKPLIAIPLNQLHLILPGATGAMLAMSVSAAAHFVVNQLPPQSN
jgi:hypothetical protein